MVDEHIGYGVALTHADKYWCDVGEGRHYHGSHGCGGAGARVQRQCARRVASVLERLEEAVGVAWGGVAGIDGAALPLLQPRSNVKRVGTQSEFTDRSDPEFAHTPYLCCQDRLARDTSRGALERFLRVTDEYMLQPINLAYL